MSYDKLQFIAYVLNTNIKPAVLNPPAVIANPCYLGLDAPAGAYTATDTAALQEIGVVADNTTQGIAAQDIAARIALVKRAISLAATKVSAANDGGKTLKVFMMPEFFFRGTTGAYSMDSVQAVVTGLRKLVRDAAYADWLFVFGTIVGCSRPAAQDLGWYQWFQNLFGNHPVSDIYNFSLIQRGGADASSDSSHVVMKELSAQNDFIRDDRLLQGKPLVPADMLVTSKIRVLPAGAAGQGKENQVFNFDGRGIFDCAGIRFGMEICLDHRAKRLVGSPQLPGDKQVQVQLVSSCGMYQQDAALILGESGLAFCCDGNGFGATATRPRATPVVTLLPVEYPVSADPLSSAGHQVPVAQLFGPSRPANAGAPGAGVRDSSDPGCEAGSIVVYSAVPLPAPSVVPGKIRQFRATMRDYTVDVALLYGVNNTFITASATISNQALGLNARTQLLPFTLTAVDASGERGQLTLALKTGGAGYDLAVDCKSTLPDFCQSGRVIEFNRDFNGATLTTWQALNPAPANANAPLAASVAH
jgi:hypothetical protein